MSTLITSKRYGAEMRIKLDSFPSCCGAKSIHSFWVNRGEELTEEQKVKMYEELLFRLGESCSGILIAADCVLNYGEWANLRRSGGGGSDNWQKADGDTVEVSLEDFCEHFGFVRGPVAKNTNSGNFVASFSYAVHSVNEKKNSEKIYNAPSELPDFSDDEQVKSGTATNLEEILKELESAIRAQS